MAVISKHDTSTRANDPNESELHERLASAIGRSEGRTAVRGVAEVVDRSRQGRRGGLPADRAVPGAA